MLPDADEECLKDSSWFSSEVLNRIAGDEGKGSPAYLEGEGGNATGERANFDTDDADDTE